MIRLYILLLMTMFMQFLQAQERLNLYKELPNTKDTADLSKNLPELYRYVPQEIKSSTVFLIIPGGGYTHIAMDHEGHQVAQRLAANGYCAYVLKYRLPSQKQQTDKRIAPIQDAQQALIRIKEEAGNLALLSPKFGVIGFSAGGHLASTLSTHFEMDYNQAGYVADNLRPDFSVLIYPVITMEDGITHNGSKNKLIGPDFTDQDVYRFSNEKQINSKTPPAFLVHAKDDKVVPIENSYRYQLELQKNNITNFLFSYELGGHGFGMYNKQEARDWFDPMLQWVDSLKF